MAVNYTILGERIRKLRKERGLSQSRLAELSNLAVPYISHIETARKKASLDSLVRIAEALDVTVDELLCGNQTANSYEFYSDLSQLLSDCSPAERQIILESAATTKCGLRKYLNLLDYFESY